MTYTFIKKITITTDDEDALLPDIVGHNISVAIQRAIPQRENCRVVVEDLDVDQEKRKEAIAFLEFADHHFFQDGPNVNTWFNRITGNPHTYEMVYEVYLLHLQNSK